jgi:acetylornithine deacetylase/succinyl-diaminopimelate desuccinylase-like protein
MDGRHTPRSWPRRAPARLAAVAAVVAALAGDRARAATVAAPSAAAVAHEARAWRQAHERAILAEFASLVALPNVAADAPGIERNVAALQSLLERRGLRVQVLRSGSAPPIVVGDLPARGKAARTIAFYAHYDGQPADTLGWHGLPWTPVLRDAAGRDVPLAGDAPLDPESRLYARSAGDDKAPIMAMLVALDALRAARRTPGFGLRIVLEGEEEAGSPHLADYMARYPAVLRPDAWLICDGPVHQSGRMELGFGARGTTAVEMTVYGPVKSLHDGHYGNWVPNPIVRLANLIASMRDDDGSIRIAGFMDDVLPMSPAERAALAAVPDVESQLRAEFQIGAPEGRGEALNARLMLPALNVRGIQSGNVGERATNSIPTEARASLDFRLVPSQTPEGVRRRLEQHLAALGWTVLAATPDSATRVSHDKLVKLAWGAGYPPARTSLDLPLSAEITAVLAAVGRDPVRLPTLGGSVPMYLFQQPHGTPAIILPIANHDDNQHAPNENLRLQNLWDGIEVFAALFATLAR